MLAIAALLVLAAPADGFVSHQVRAPTLRPFVGPPEPADINLSDLVPNAGRLDYVWYVPAGRTVPQVAVAWQFHSSERVLGWNDQRRYVLTLWTPEHVTAGSATWLPHTLIRSSPYSLVGRSIRLADVTADGHDDLLVTVMCGDCNHATAVVSVYATLGHFVRRIYGGAGVLSVAKGRGPDALVRGRLISETAWGARNGLVWFDQPWGGTSVCCAPFRMQTFLHWSAHGWRTVTRKRIRPKDDVLVAQGYPAP